jgi:hypothetical protein
VKTDYNGIALCHPRHALNANIHLFHFLIRAIFMQRNNAMTKYFPSHSSVGCQLHPIHVEHGRTFNSFASPCHPINYARLIVELLYVFLKFSWLFSLVRGTLIDSWRAARALPSTAVLIIEIKSFHSFR